MEVLWWIGIGAIIIWVAVVKSKGTMQERGFRSNQLDNALLGEKKRGKTHEQCMCLDYFYEKPGCFSKIMSDSQYNELVYERFKELDKQEVALEKLGIDIDQVNEIPPVNFYGFDLDNGPWVRQLSGKWVSPYYDLTWIFFSDTQIYMYYCSFDMFSKKVNQSTQEYFYKDVTSFKTETRSPKDFPGGDDIRYEEFSIIVPGDSVSVSMQDTEENSSSIIAAMKQKLREKKNS